MTTYVGPCLKNWDEPLLRLGYLPVPPTKKKERCVVPFSQWPALVAQVLREHRVQ